MVFLDFNKIELNKKIRIGLGLSLLILILASGIAYYALQKFIDQSKWVDHTNEVMFNLENSLSSLRAAETNQRGYLLTGNKPFLKSYEQFRTNSSTVLQRIKKLTQDNPVQQSHIRLLQTTIERRFYKMDLLITYYEEHHVVDVALLKEGKLIMEQYSDIITTMKVEEQRLYASRTSEVAQYAFYTPIIIIVSSLFAVFISFFSFYFISRDLKNKAVFQQQLTKLNQDLEANYAELDSSKNELYKQNYILNATTELNDLLRAEKDLQIAGDKILTYFCEFMKAQAGLLYVIDDYSRYRLMNHYALEIDSTVVTNFMSGEGLLGQSVLQNKSMLLTDVPSDSIKIKSGMSTTNPCAIFIIPFVFDNQSIAVIELLKKDPFSILDLEFMKAVANNIGIFIKGLKAEAKTILLLEETQRQAEILEVQQEELRQTNEELEEQAKNLKQQQEELEVANEELEHQTLSIEVKNKELERAIFEVEKKTTDLQLSSKYKSEFLANMSHELRTPLNSLLILSKDLSENKKKNLDQPQIESAQIIYNSGQDLLQLINEVLDLSKIEAGKMELNIERIAITDLTTNLSRSFKHIAEKKGLKFSVHLAEELPTHIYTDQQRIEQILRNLISNAIKFTHHGSVTLAINKLANQNITFSVQDTGIGITPEKHALIFEAFQQAEGGTSRKYGGTGLGLSISKELAKLINGHISLSSTPEMGSTFVLTVPQSISHTAGVVPLMTSEIDLDHNDFKKDKFDEDIAPIHSIADDRAQTSQEDKSILIIEDDESFAKILMEQARERDFKVLVTATGEEGLTLAAKFIPKAIILDLTLPMMDGKAVLSELKGNPTLRHIPVHVISASDKTSEIIKRGVVEYLRKPVTRDDLETAFAKIEGFINRKVKNLLIVEDNDNSRASIKLLIGNSEVNCLEATTGSEALRLIQENHIDCMVLDLGLPDMTGFELIGHLEKGDKDNIPPIVVYTGRELSKDENEVLQRYAETIIIKGVKSEERLLDETAMFLHRTIEKLPETQKQIITELYDKEAIFVQKKILLVDDDMRNIFALSKVLKEKGMEIIKAENGIKALEALDKQPEIDLVLMDIMMPEMDGYEAMRRIRTQKRFQELPIIALTAKAMKEDKVKCIEAGANDYFSKPIDTDRLLSLMRIWIRK